jgi:hypothetical protein
MDIFTSIGPLMDHAKNISLIIKKIFALLSFSRKPLVPFVFGRPTLLPKVLFRHGVGIGIFSGFGTGLVFNAMALENTALQNISPLAILITPFGIMEIFSYGLAISRSGMLRKYYQNRVR